MYFEGTAFVIQACCFHFHAVNPPLLPWATQKLVLILAKCILYLVTHVHFMYLFLLIKYFILLM